MKKRDMVTIIGYVLVGLFLASNMVCIISARNNNPNNNNLNPNRITSYRFPEFFIKNERMYYLGEKRTIEIIDVQNVNQICKIDEYKLDEFDKMINFENVTFAIKRPKPINSTHSEISLQILDFDENNRFEKLSEFPIIRETLGIFSGDMHLPERSDGKTYWYQKEKYNDEACIVMVNCTDRTNPDLVMRYTKAMLDLDDLWGFKFYKDIMCTLTEKEDQLQFVIYNISNPIEPKKISQWIPIHQSNTNYYIKDSLLYHAFNNNSEDWGIDIYNIAHSEGPKYLSSIHTENKVLDIVFSGSYLYINILSKILIYEQQLDNTLELKGSFNTDIQDIYHEAICHGIGTANRLYYCRRSSSLERVFSVIDTSNPLKLTETVFGPPFSTNLVSLPKILIIGELTAVLVVYFFIIKKKRENIC